VTSKQQIHNKHPWVVKLSWLENAYVHPGLSTNDLDQESRSWWPSFWCV